MLKDLRTPFRGPDVIDLDVGKEKKRAVDLVSSAVDDILRNGICDGDMDVLWDEVRDEPFRLNWISFDNQILDHVLPSIAQLWHENVEYLHKNVDPCWSGDDVQTAGAVLLSTLLIVRETAINASRKYRGRGCDFFVECKCFVRILCRLMSIKPYQALGRAVTTQPSNLELIMDSLNKFKFPW